MSTEFKTGSALVFCIIFAFITCLIGVVLSLVLKPWIGALAIALGLLIPAMVWYFATACVIRCADTGFAVDESSKRKGSRHKEFRWSDVTKTQYEEIQTRSSGDNDMRPVVYFSVFCGEERAFKISRIRRFKELVALFNEKTPQLPYTWQPRAGITVQVGPLTAGRAAYVQVPRT